MQPCPKMLLCLESMICLQKKLHGNVYDNQLKPFWETNPRYDLWLLYTEYQHGKANDNVFLSKSWLFVTSWHLNGRRFWLVNIRCDVTIVWYHYYVKAICYAVTIEWCYDNILHKSAEWYDWNKVSTICLACLFYMKRRYHRHS